MGKPTFYGDDEFVFNSKADIKECLMIILESSSDF